MSTKTKTLRIGHSPDPDDAFMWYPLANFPDNTGPGGKTYKPCINTRGYEFVHVLEDIQSLNQRSENGELEITAISIHQYPYVAKQYALTSCGSSMGDGYGPMVIAREDFDLRKLILPLTTPGRDNRATTPRIAIPGKRTSAWLAFQLRMMDEGAKPGSAHDINSEVVPFDEIIPRVASGEFDAGLIIHEGQLTYQNQGLVCVEDLGKWWAETRRLPLPLGGNCIRRDVGDEMPVICRVLLDSISYALENRDEAIEYAMNYARDMKSDLADEFIGMYVNKMTLDYGETGRQAVAQFLKEGVEAGFIPDCGEVDFVEPA